MCGAIPGLPLEGGGGADAALSTLRSGCDGHFWYRIAHHRFGSKNEALAFAFPSEERAASRAATAATGTSRGALNAPVHGRSTRRAAAWGGEPAPMDTSSPPGAA